jgi:hypothetical protein
MGLWERFQGWWRMRGAEQAVEEASEAQRRAVKALDEALRLQGRAEHLSDLLPTIPWYRPLQAYFTERKVHFSREKSAAAWQRARCRMQDADALRAHASALIREAESYLSPGQGRIGGNWVLQPGHYAEARQTLERIAGIPERSGAYGIYFKAHSFAVPNEAFLEVDGFQLLYFGIAGYPRRRERRLNLRQRIAGDLGGTAWDSELRLHVGILLEEKLNLELVAGGPGQPYQWSDESALTEWMGANATVSWMESERPWLLEHQALMGYGHLLPLNVEFNEFKEFSLRLKSRRRELRGKISNY